MNLLVHIATLGLEHKLKSTRDEQLQRTIEEFRKNDVVSLNHRISDRLLDGTGKTFVKNLEKVVKVVATQLFQVEFKKVRPDWLRNVVHEKRSRLELDLFNPSLGINAVAIEVQGRQHYAFGPHFH